MCAVGVTEVHDALAYLACNADVLALDPMRLDHVLGTIPSVADATGTPDVTSELLASQRSDWPP